MIAFDLVTPPQSSPHFININLGAHSNSMCQSAFYDCIKRQSDATLSKKLEGSVHNQVAPVSLGLWQQTMAGVHGGEAHSIDSLE